MGYFSHDDIQALNSKNVSEKERLQKHFLALHKKVYDYIQNNNYDLNIINPNKSAVHNQTVSQQEPEDVLVVQYLRKRGQAVAIEKLMGREGVASVNNIIIKLHLIIELRLTSSGFAIELIASPDAWFDQQNLQGKLSVTRHRHEFYSTLMKLDEQYCMGFWQGAHLSDMHLSGKYFPHARILDEWMGTFHPNADWFRVGMWYDLDDEAIASDMIVKTLTTQIDHLYPLYQYFLWTSNNNFREFSDSESS